MCIYLIRQESVLRLEIYTLLVCRLPLVTIGNSKQLNVCPPCSGSIERERNAFEQIQDVELSNNIRDCWCILNDIYLLQLSTSTAHFLTGKRNNNQQSFSVIQDGRFDSCLGRISFSFPSVLILCPKKLSPLYPTHIILRCQSRKRVIFRAKSVMKERHERAIQSLFWPNNNVKL